MSSKGSSDPLVRTYATSLRTQVAYLSEARVYEIAQGASESSRYFVKAFEGGRVDCGIYQGPLQLPDNPTEKLLAILEAGTNKKTIVPLEFKDIAPHRHKGAIYWSIKLSQP